MKKLLSVLLVLSMLAALPLLSSAEEEKEIGRASCRERV